MANQVAPPDRTAWRYGLSSVAELNEHGDRFRLVADYTFDSVACNTGIVWEPACGPVFTVTFTKSATDDTFDVTVDQGVVGDYEINVNAGGFVALTSTVVSTDAAPTPVTVREVAGLQRSVTITDVDFDSTEGSVYTFVSQQTDNDPKVFTEGIGAPSGSPFVVIGGAVCTPMADYDWDVLAQEALTAVEWPNVERRFWERQLAAASPVIPVAGAQTLVNAVAVLEDYARGISGFEATLHGASFLGAHAASQGVITAIPDGLIKYTTLHTPWAFGGGYPRTGPDGEAAPTATQAWLFLTGKVAVHRGAAFVPGSEGERFTQANNQLFIMAERSYAVIPDCPLAAVLVETEPA